MYIEYHLHRYIPRYIKIYVPRKYVMSTRRAITSAKSGSEIKVCGQRCKGGTSSLTSLVAYLHNLPTYLKYLLTYVPMYIVCREVSGAIPDV